MIDDIILKPANFDGQDIRPVGDEISISFSIESKQETMDNIRKVYDDNDLSKYNALIYYAGSYGQAWSEKMTPDDDEEFYIDNFFDHISNTLDLIADDEDLENWV